MDMHMLLLVKHLLLINFFDDASVLVPAGIPFRPLALLDAVPMAVTSGAAALSREVLRIAVGAGTAAPVVAGVQSDVRGSVVCAKDVSGTTSVCFEDDAGICLHGLKLHTHT